MIEVAEKVKEGDWAVLIVLDACRYDYFKKNYGHFLKGKLKKGISNCTSTPTWLSNNFRDGDYSDVIYLSANPHINSLHMKNNGNFFLKVIDVWDWGWDKRLRTVHPMAINMAFKTLMQRKDSKKFRYILHYLQPHAPFVGVEESQLLSMSLLRKSMKTFGEVARKAFGTERLWSMIKKIAGPKGPMPKLDPYYVTYYLYGKEGLKKAYEDNLLFILKWVQALLRDLDGKMEGNIIVTADHGELLGEDDCYGHIFVDDKKPALITVPWLKVNL